MLRACSDRYYIGSFYADTNFDRLYRRPNKLNKYMMVL